MEYFLSIDFHYEDADSYQNEISEIYSYSEETEFFANRNAFEELMEDCCLPLTWKSMVQEQKRQAVSYLLTALEVSSRSTRLKTCRALAYLVQGNFGECLSLEEQARNSQENVQYLYEQGLFQAFVQQLMIEADLSSRETRTEQTSCPASQIFEDSSNLRLILSVLCTVTETMYRLKDSTDLRSQEVLQQFTYELQSPVGDDLLIVFLFQMLNDFCGGVAPHYPVRKVVLLLWKIILVTLGGTETLKELKRANRLSAGLEPPLDDIIDVTKNMRPCSPPVMRDGQVRDRIPLSLRDRRGIGQSEAMSSNYAASKRKVFHRTPAFDDAVLAYAKECLLAASLNEFNQDNENPEESSENGIFIHELDERYSFKKNYEDSVSISKQDLDECSSDTGINEEEGSLGAPNAQQDFPPPTKTLDSAENIDGPRPEDDTFIDDFLVLKTKPTDVREVGSRSDDATTYKGLPWAPKVRKADLSLHLSTIRQKFLGYTLPNDLETTFGLPDPIVEGINVLKSHLYISLSEVQLEREEMIEKYPLTHKELNENYAAAPTEKLYRALLPRLPQYMIALLKILLAASTNSKDKTERTESINIMCEMSPDEENPSIIHTMKMKVDANRHKEVIIKAVSAILILLLKHFKVNHIYQFEYVSQQLMFANCIPLILKFLSQDIGIFIVSSKSTISAIDFPACVIGEQPELTAEAIELCSFQPYFWRNMFSCVNLVRVLNKLTKWKHSRIMMLVVFKSAPSLSKALCVRNSMFQLYVLKLLKVQLKFLGRQWKKSNMKLLSAIYQKVRHRLTDDWAYSNDNEAKPWDFQAEEFTLQANINKFHLRRYQELLYPTYRAGECPVSNQYEKINRYEDRADEDYDFGTDDANHISPLFERNYERWLESEVFQRHIAWDKLLRD